ncbi:MAG: V-type ATPase subunit [Nitrospirota bacterium]
MTPFAREAMGERAPDNAGDLLRQERTEGYPPEYLFSRVRGRRSRLIRDWRPLIYDDSPADYLSSPQYHGFVRERTAAGMWRALLQEHGWIHRQMDEATRKIFAPYFLYAELRTIFICLRYLEGDKALKTGEVLNVSLLSSEVKEMLRTGEVRGALAGLDRLVNALSPAEPALPELYERKGLREVERSLTDRYLSFVLKQPLHAVLRGFFIRIIDSRNLLGLYKSLRMQTVGKGIFLAGGTVQVGQLQEVLEKGDIFAVAGLIRRASGVAVSSPDPTQVEVALYRGVTRYLREEGRDPLAAALLLDYLWRASLEVMNLSLLIAGKDLEREEIAAELAR